MKRLLLLTFVTVSAADLDSVLRQVVVYEYGQNPAAVRDLENAALKAAGTSDTANIEKQVLTALPMAKTPAAGDALVRSLAIVGSAASVPALAPRLKFPDTVEVARYALEAIPGPESLEALRGALSTAPATAKSGIIVSLGRRRDAQSIDLLVPLLSDPALSSAAATALGNIGGDKARRALADAKPTPAVNDALLVVAESSPATEAQAIYKRLCGKENPESFRIAALRGLARTKDGPAIIQSALKDPSPHLQAAAIREIVAVERASSARRLPELNTRAKIQLLSALADSGSLDSVPVLEQAASSTESDVRIAALDGLAKIGGAKQIGLLASRAATSTGDEQAAARMALASVRGTDADAAVIQALSASADSKVKAEMIRAAGERGITSAADALLKTAVDSDRKVRAESIRALRETASKPQVPALVALLVKTEDENERKEYERTVAAAIRRSKEADVTDVISSLKSSKDTDVSTSLMNVLSAVGNNDGLPVLKEALSARDAGTKRAAVNALAAWPSAEPAESLIALARSESNVSLQALALRGYVRLIQLPSKRLPAETARLLGTAMEAAKRPEEKKIVIAALQRVPARESLELVKAAASDPAVAAEANAAITALERSLSFRRN